MKNLKEAIQKIIENQKYFNLINKFAKEKFDKKFAKKSTENNSWTNYDKFEIISKTEIRIHYSYGGGDMEFNGWFDINLNDEIK